MLFSRHNHDIDRVRGAAVSGIVARCWDYRAVETSLQGSLVTALSRHVNECVLPRNRQTIFESYSEYGIPVKRAQHMEKDILAARQLDYWYTELESRHRIKEIENPRHHTEAFKNSARTCDEVLTKLLDARRLMGAIRLHLGFLKFRSNVIRRKSTKVASKKQRLRDIASIIRKRLRCFSNLNVASRSLSACISQVDSRDFVDILKILEACSTFIDAHAEYADYTAQSIKCEQLQVRALSAVRARVVAVVCEAALLPLGDLGDFKIAFTGAKNLNGSFLNAKFRSELSSLRHIIDYIDARGKRDVTPRNQNIYTRVIIDCCSTYCEQRISLILDPIRTQLLDYSASLDLTQFAQTGCSFMFQVLKGEHELFCRVFPLHNDDAAKSLTPFGESLGMLLLEIFRPRYIHLNNISVIADLIDTLRNQEDGFSVTSQNRGMTFSLIIQRLIADVQERLIFRAHTFIQEKVANYRPSTDDLNYPLMLVAPEVKSSSVGGEVVELFPPVVSTLSFLGTLYRSLDGNTFSGLAEDAVLQCLMSIKKSSQIVASSASESDGLLFMIKYLILLREHISPFESHLTEHFLPTRELNFSHLNGEMQRMLNGGLSVFSISPTENALVVLATKGAPRVVESTADCRTELEKLLRSSCEAYIMHLTRTIVGPILGFLAKLTAFRVSSPHVNAPLSKAAFATGERLSKVVASVNNSLENDLTRMVKHMSLYVTGASTREIILNPVKNNIVEAHRQMAAVLQKYYGDIYMERLKLKTPDELAELLQRLEC